MGEGWRELDVDPVRLRREGSVLAGEQLVLKVHCSLSVRFQITGSGSLSKCVCVSLDGGGGR